MNEYWKVDNRPWYAAVLALFVFLMAGLWLFVAGCVTNVPSAPIIEPAVSPPSAPAEIRLQPIREWSGAGTKSTEPFTINQSPWVIAWALEPEMFEGQSWAVFNVMVYNATDGSPITLAVTATERGSDYTYVYETGAFYLEINAANGQWAIKVLAAPSCGS